MKYKKIILIILICLWMIIIFSFSNQKSEKSSSTSGGTIVFVLEKLSITKDMNNEQIQKLVEILQTPIRKLAHFSVYVLGGFLSMLYANQYKISNKRRIVFSLVFCMLYAISDEIHQYFVPR